MKITIVDTPKGLRVRAFVRDEKTSKSFDGFYDDPKNVELLCNVIRDLLILWDNV